MEIENDTTNTNLAVRIDDLKQKVGLSPNDYQLRIDLINTLRNAKRYNEASTHRIALMEQYPLTESMYLTLLVVLIINFIQDVWIDWLDDEIHIFFKEENLNAENFQRVNQLFESSIKDYLSVNLWLKWPKFLGELISILTLHQDIVQGIDIDTEYVRSIYERGLDLMSHHVADAKLFWDQYRSFEMNNFSNATNEAQKQEFVEKIRKLFRRELQTPHIGMQEVYETIYKPWEISILGVDESNFVSPFEAQYRKALEALEERLPFEEQISEIKNTDPLNPDYNMLHIWKSYIEFENAQTKVSLGRVRCLYERAIVNYFLVLDLWDEYTSFAGTHIKNNQKLLLSIHTRSVRNYPYSYILWCKLLLAFETCRQSSDIIDESFSRALMAGLHTPNDVLQIYRQYLDCYTRQITKWDADNPSLLKLRSMFDQAFDYFNSYLPELALKIYTHRIGIEQHRSKDFAQVAMIYEAMLKKFSKTAEVYIAYAQFHINQEHIKEARSLFKRASGTKLDNPVAVYDAWLEFERIFGSIDDYKYAFDKSLKSLKDQVTETNFNMSESVEISNETNSRKKRKTEDEAPEPKKAAQNDQEECTLFVSNLPTNTTKESLEVFFNRVCQPKSIRIPKHRSTGEPRKIAYVDFNNDEDLQQALEKLNNQLFVGKRLKLEKSIKQQPRRASYEQPRSVEKMEVDEEPTSFVPRAVRSGQRKRINL